MGPEEFPERPRVKFNFYKPPVECDLQELRSIAESHTYHESLVNFPVKLDSDGNPTAEIHTLTDYKTELEQRLLSESQVS